MDNAMWKVAARVIRRGDGSWRETTTYGGSPGGNTSIEAAEKWAATASGPSPELVHGIFVRVEYPAPHGIVSVIVKIKPRVVYDCEHFEEE